MLSICRLCEAKRCMWQLNAVCDNRKYCRIPKVFITVTRTSTVCRVNVFLTFLNRVVADLVRRWQMVPECDAARRNKLQTKSHFDNAVQFSTHGLWDSSQLLRQRRASRVWNIPFNVDIYPPHPSSSLPSWAYDCCILLLLAVYTRRFHNEVLGQR